MFLESGQAGELIERHGAKDGAGLLAAMLGALPGRIAAVSSFGVESALLLALVAEVDRAVPVLFLDTGKHFGETLRYRDKLADRLGLSEVRILRPAPEDEARLDAAGVLWMDDPDACCGFRKVAPLDRALAPFAGWISGRKRYQGGLRAALPALELADGRLKINPLAGWSRDRVEAEFERRDLPRHPLQADGFTSVGCMPCSERTAPGEGDREGRWRGFAKIECGIHLPRSANAR